VGNLPNPVIVSANVIIFDDVQMFSLPKLSVFPKNLDVGICVAWDLMKLQHSQTTIMKMGYNVNFIVSCLHKNSYRQSLGGVKNAPKTNIFFLILFSSSAGEKLSWFGDEKDVTLPLQVCLFFFICSKLFILFRFQLSLVLKNLNQLVATSLSMHFQYLFGK